MRLTLAVPDLIACDRETLGSARSLARLARYAGEPLTRHGGLDSFLVGESQEHDAAGTAPLAALGAGFDPGAAYVLRADPVSLVAGRADVMLAARIDDLDPSEAGALIATLNAHFDHDRVVFHAPRPDAWFVTIDETPELSTTPLSAVRGSLHPHLPAGNDAAKWRRWLSEMQMLLHEHPENGAREVRRLLPVTGIWISDGGRLADVDRVSPAAIFATAGRAGDVARGLARLAGIAAQEPPANFASLFASPPMQDNAVVALGPADDASLSTLDRHWIDPAVTALERGALSSLRLLADGNGLAALWHAKRPTLAPRVLAKLRARAFTPPLPDEDDA